MNEIMKFLSKKLEEVNETNFTREKIDNVKKAVGFFIDNAKNITLNEKVKTKKFFSVLIKIKFSTLKIFKRVLLKVILARNQLIEAQGKKRRILKMLRLALILRLLKKKKLKKRKKEEK